MSYHLDKGITLKLKHLPSEVVTTVVSGVVNDTVVVAGVVVVEGTVD